MTRLGHRNQLAGRARAMPSPSSAPREDDASDMIRHPRPSAPAVQDCGIACPRARDRPHDRSLIAGWVRLGKAVRSTLSAVMGRRQGHHGAGLIRRPAKTVAGTPGRAPRPHPDESARTARLHVSWENKIHAPTRAARPLRPAAKPAEATAPRRNRTIRGDRTHAGRSAIEGAQTAGQDSLGQRSSGSGQVYNPTEFHEGWRSTSATKLATSATPVDPKRALTRHAGELGSVEPRQRLDGIAREVSLVIDVEAYRRDHARCRSLHGRPTTKSMFASAGG
jgi:hypothetical protein